MMIYVACLKWGFLGQTNHIDERYKTADLWNFVKKKLVCPTDLFSWPAFVSLFIVLWSTTSH